MARALLLRALLRRNAHVRPAHSHLRERTHRGPRETKRAPSREGKCADLIITTDNPLEDVCALRHVDMVMTRGKLIRNPQVKKIEACERELDKFI